MVGDGSRGHNERLGWPLACLPRGFTLSFLRDSRRLGAKQNRSGSGSAVTRLKRRVYSSVRHRQWVYGSPSLAATQQSLSSQPPCVFATWICRA